jgi:hypothetical protein
VVIIALLAALSLGALRKTQESARVSKTKAIIAKLHDIIMPKYEAYLTRRVPITFPPNTPPSAMAQMRLDAIRELMRLEMPDRWRDIDPTSGPTAFSTPIGATQYAWSVPQPALSKIYCAKRQALPPTITNSATNAQAKCLYLFVATSSPEALGQFTADEIGDVDGDGWREFLDGWGNPIMWLRWAPGFSAQIPPQSSPHSDIQFADSTGHHDPLDGRNIDSPAYQLFPLIFSSGGDRMDTCLNLGNDFDKATPSTSFPWTTYQTTIDSASTTVQYPYQFQYKPTTNNPNNVTSPIGTVLTRMPISNQHMEQR